MAEDKNAIETEAYLPLKKFRFEIGAAAAEEGSCFSFCFWVYLPNSTPFPSVIIHQVNSQIKEGTPLLALNKMKKLVLFPLLPLQSEALDLNDTTLWNEIPHASMASEFPLARWSHVGCEVSTDLVRLHINGELVDEKPLSSYRTEDQRSGVLKTLTLFCNNVAAEGYVYKPMERSTLLSIEDDYYTDSPVHLSIDNSSASDIEEDIDGVWSIIGGKASCRRNFSLDVVLLDAFDKSVDKEVEVAASLVYADNGAPIEKTSDGEAPLLTTYDGMEFNSNDRPSKLLHGHASFKLKISQLSSKCDNRLFRISFHLLEAGNYPFLEASSLPIRCISRNRTSKPSSLIIWKRPSLGNFSSNTSHSSRVNDRFLELHRNTVREAKTGPLSKRVKLGNDTFEQSDDDGKSHARDSIQFCYQTNNGFHPCSKMKAEICDVADKSPSDSECRKMETLALSSPGKAVPDLTIFQYCLGGIAERTILLKDIVTSSSNEEVLEFADQVSLYSGCSHHRNQIIVARRLIDEGKTFWNMVSHNHQTLYWGSVVLEIEEHFKRITCCTTRSLTQEDFEVLRRIAGCRDIVTQEHFEKMWCWLYPVAFTLSRHKIRDMWSCTSPYWIEGFISKEEAELSLQGPSGLQEPGTFILRFPTSRSWPHPDAGSLVVTYVGSDYSLHHKLLAIDHFYSSEGDKGTKTLPEMLLAETELSHLGRMLRIR